MTTKDIIEQTKQLIAIRSTADNPEGLRQAVDFVANILAEHQGITIERFEQNGKPSFLAYRKGPRPERFDILLNGHVDVVPGAAKLFKAYEKDGKLYGRGALDMKGTVLVLAHLFCELVNEVPYSLGLQVVSDEEIGGYDCAQVQINQGVRANFVVMGEYANDRHTIYNAARGLCWAEIAFKGKTAHGGHLWNGSNAVVKAGSFAAAVLKRYPTPDKETWTTTASIADLSTPNDAYNKVPDKAILKIDFRFTQEDPVFYTRESLEAFIHELDPDAELLNTLPFEPSVHVDEMNPYVQGMSRALTNVTGKKPQFLGRPAGSDGRHFALVDSDIVEFGLYGQGSHSDHEHVEVASFDEYRHIMLQFLQQPIPKKLESAQPSEPLHEQLLRKLVEIPSVSENFTANNAIMHYINDFLTKRGMFVEQIDINGFRSLVATTRRGDRKPTVLLNAHSDVVTAPKDLFKLTLKDGKFYGRGVMDMKHAIAAYLAVVDSLKDELDRYDFGLMITSDEEIGSNNGVKPLLQMGYGAKVVIIPDGGNDWRLETFAKGVKWVKLEASGKVAHASRPWEGESAIHRLFDAIHDIKQLVPKHPKPEDSLLSVGTISGGTVANQIPTEATAMLDVRPGSLADHERLTPAIQQICDDHGIKATFQADEPPCVTDPEDPWVKPMTQIVEHITGKTHGTCYDFAVTDGRLFSAVGISTIVINPECGNIHREDEWLGQESFGQFCKAIEAYVRRMALRKAPAVIDKPAEIAQLANRLVKDGERAHVWFASYGSGLSKQNFMHQIQGGQSEGSSRVYPGCSNTTAPQKDAFVSIPHRLYFAGNCAAWNGCGHINVEIEPSEARTIARAYFISVDQLEEIVAQQNDRTGRQSLPLKEAMQHGHAVIGGGEGHYNVLIFCGIKDNVPIFSITTNLNLPITPPSPIYTRLLCKGLSENAEFNQTKAIDYILSTRGVKGAYQKGDIAQLFNESVPKKVKSTTKR